MLVQKLRGFLPPEFVNGHNLAYLLHDIMLELLRSGEEHNIFNTRITFEDEDDCTGFEQAEDIFMWLEQKKKLGERASVLRAVVFPAVLSDMLHFIYEALECSRKAKLNVTYALLRKPLQENLFILESIARDPYEFAEYLATKPFRLQATKVGGVDVHSHLISELLKNLHIGDQFDAQYLAQLRYEKCDDGFDGVCNLAMHLFTGHPKIRTDALNVNFVFSGWDQKVTQWRYLYSRLPYILAYTREIVEHVGGHIAITAPEYLEDLKFRVASESLSWWESIPEEYMTSELKRFADAQAQWLERYHEYPKVSGPSKPKLRVLLQRLFRRILRGHFLQ